MPNNNDELIKTAAKQLGIDPAKLAGVVASGKQEDLLTLIPKQYHEKLIMMMKNVKKKN